MRANGVRSLDEPCCQCHHGTIMSADVTAEKIGAVTGIATAASEGDEAMTGA
jgi:hypothetical protein